MVTGRGFNPAEVPLATTVWNEKILSLATASPFVPSLKNCCEAEPPIKCRSPTTLIPVLTGFEPGVTFTVRSVAPPSCRLAGVADPVPVGGVDKGVTVREIEALPVRDCASVMVAGRILAPALVAPGTVASDENTLSPAVRSPCVPSSKNCCVAEPPIALRLALTARPVLTGFAPGVTAIVKSEEFPACTVAGLAAPAPAGFVEALVLPSMEMSSMASACALVVVVPEATE